MNGGETGVKGKVLTNEDGAKRASARKPTCH